MKKLIAFIIGVGCFTTDYIWIENALQNDYVSKIEVVVWFWLGYCGLCAFGYAAQNIFNTITDILMNCDGE